MRARPDHRRCRRCSGAASSCPHRWAEDRVVLLEAVRLRSVSTIRSPKRCCRLSTSSTGCVIAGCISDRREDGPSRCSDRESADRSHDHFRFLRRRAFDAPRHGCPRRRARKRYVRVSLLNAAIPSPIRTRRTAEACRSALLLLGSFGGFGLIAFAQCRWLTLPRSAPLDPRVRREAEQVLGEERRRPHSTTGPSARRSRASQGQVRTARRAGRGLARRAWRVRHTVSAARPFQPRGWLKPRPRRTAADVPARAASAFATERRAIPINHVSGSPFRGS